MHASVEECFPSLAVAIDKDKGSQQAVKWAIDHLLANSMVLALVHVRTTRGDGGKTGTDTLELFRSYRMFCARKGIQMKEVLLEQSDISKALLEYIYTNHINNIVLGASNRNAITRKFRNPDVPSQLMKGAPDFCSVYVIWKGKTTSSKKAKSLPPSLSPTPRMSPLGTSPLHPSLGPSDPEEQMRVAAAGRGAWRAPLPPASGSDRQSFERSNDFMKMVSRDRPLSAAKSVPTQLDGAGAMDPSMRPPRLSNCSRDSFSDDLDLQANVGFQSSDFGDLELSSVSNDSSIGTISPTAVNRDMEAEMKRLKLELKQTMDLYSNACKEAITAKQKAKELHEWNVEEARKFEEARQAEEMALAVAEMEKARCREAIEAAQAAQKAAETEAQRRQRAEMAAKREAEEKKKALQALAHNDVRYRKYTIDEIEAATDHFAEGLKLGEGGYGPVYRGNLDHTPSAIKVLRPDAAQGRKQFQQEVEVLSCIRHPNMVLLMGACPEYGCLVYEYMDNGSLEDRIFRRGGTPPIPWPTRFKIAAEIATALLFLHQTKPEPLVHRDLKPANILLDRNYTSKISDVGLARLVPPSVVDTVTQYRMTSTAGTFCYIDPEYQQTGMLGTKSDIYSLGILLLQVITAKPPMALSHHVERAIDRGTFREMLDPAIHDWPMDEALSFARIALRCCELRRKDRPDLGTVVLPQLNRLRRLGQGLESASASSSSLSTSSSSFSSPKVENVGSLSRSQPNRLGTGTPPRPCSQMNQVVARSNPRATAAADVGKMGGTSPAV